MLALFHPRRGCSCYLSSSSNNKAQRDLCNLLNLPSCRTGACWMRSGNGLQVLKVNSEVLVLAQGDGELAVSMLWLLGSMLPRQVSLG